MGLKETLMMHWCNLVTKYPMLLGAGGQNTKNYVMSIIWAIGTVIMGGGGAWLVIMGAKDLIKALQGENKDVKKACIGIGVIVLGGGFILMGIGGLQSLANSIGSDFSGIH